MTGVRAAVVLALMLACLSCGETYRPVATPIAPNPPNPNFLRVALLKDPQVRARIVQPLPPDVPPPSGDGQGPAPGMPPEATPPPATPA